MPEYSQFIRPMPTMTRQRNQTQTPDMTNSDPDPDPDLTTMAQILPCLTCLIKLRFSKGVAKALIDQQLLADSFTLLELDDDKVDDICHAMHRLGGKEDRHQITELAVNRLKLAVFYMKHLVHYIPCGY